ncbi:MAG: ankyrin repeat domain-containing protein [Rubrivivax sp.]|nr:ankyrin repeat domain-containing protein [Rubrivivax sp.]MDP3083999.1 ankyrin repeat domain-containing protein [Rubrivivax sp.]
MIKFWFKFALYLVLVVGLSAAKAGAYEDFFAAIDRDDARTVSNLLARGFDPNAVSEQGQVGLYLALREDAPKITAALLAHPAIKVDQSNGVGETPLMMAALRGRVDWMQRLLERGAAINRDGWTPLHYAASGPEPKAVALMLDRGARIDARAPNGSTALMMAARYGDEASVTLLLQRGADPKLENDKRHHAGDFARMGGREALSEKLEALTR